jgi:hypothetical protein
MKTKARKYLVVGLLIDAALLVAALVAIVIYSASSYDGRCGLGIIFGSGRHPCSRLEHTLELSFLLIVVLSVYGWWAILPVLIAPPLAGFLWGQRRVAK